MSAAVALIFLVLVFMMTVRASAQSFQIGAYSGGGGGLTNTNLGNLNALGIAPPAGLKAIRTATGTLYYSLYSITITAPGTTTVALAAYVSTPFAHPSATVLQSCAGVGTSGCNTVVQYQTMGSSAGAPTWVIPTPGVGNKVTVNPGVGIFLPDNDGPTAYIGNDSVTITFFLCTSAGTPINGTTQSIPLTETVQDAVQLTLTQAAGGLPISAGSDYSMSFGTVNAMGIGSASALKVAGGALYPTSYVLNPAFSDFTSTTGTLSVYVSKNFQSSPELTLQDAGVLAGPYATISTTSTAPTQITSSATDGASITRYLGLLVSPTGTFTGADSATLTFTLKVPN